MKRIIIICAFLATLFVLACSSDPSEQEVIISEVYGVAASSSNRLYIGTTGGLCQSLDNGETWEIANREFGGLINVSPSGTIYCKVVGKNTSQWKHDEFLFRSTDNGKTFIQTGWVRKNVTVGMLWLTFNNQEHLFCMAGDVMPKLWRSTSLGVSWEQLSVGSGWLIAPNDIFNTSDAVYRSEDNGDSWTKVLQLQSLSDTSYSHGPLTFNSQGRIFVAVNAGTYYNTEWVQIGLVYHSNDNGNTWAGSVVTNSRITHLAINSEDKIFALTEPNEVYRSENNGIQWNKVSVNSFEPMAIQFIINSNNNLFISNSYCKLYRSQDEGVTWELIQPHL